MKIILCALFLLVSFLGLSGCPETSSEEVDPGAVGEMPRPVEVKEPPISSVLGLPVPDKCSLVDGLSQTSEQRSVRVYESNETLSALVAFYEVELKRTSKIHRFRDHTEYLWSWMEEGVSKQVILRPADTALKGTTFQKDSTITLVSVPNAGQ
jgi:hypothetical protein